MNCPECGRKIEVRAVVDGLLMPPEWDFWGSRGDRFVICRKDNVVHFRAGTSHRLAVIRSSTNVLLQ